MSRASLRELFVLYFVLAFVFPATIYPPQIGEQSFVVAQGTSGWHHDCSNLTAFDGRGDNSWVHNDAVSVTFGTVDCSGAFFYCDDVGTGSGCHGPLLYHMLDEPFNVGQFVRLWAELEIDGMYDNRVGWVRVGLHAADNGTIMGLQVADPWVGTNSAYAQGFYRFGNRTTIGIPQYYPDHAILEPWHENFAILHNSSGIYTVFPWIPISCVLDESEIEHSRQIVYISIEFDGYDSNVLCETMRIHDIKLVYQSTNTSETRGVLESVVFAGGVICTIWAAVLYLRREHGDQG